MSETAELSAIKEQLCRSLCADVSVLPREDGCLLVETPFYFPDGDGYSMYLSRLPSGGFRVPNQTKARLATVVIQYLQKQNFGFHSLVVYSDMVSLPRADVARLTNAANDQLASIDSSAMWRKVEGALSA